MLNFRCPEREESFLWAEYSFQMVPAGDQVGTSALPAASDWTGGPHRYWPSQNWGGGFMAAKYPWGLLEAHCDCTQRNGRRDYCWEDRVKICQRSNRYDQSVWHGTTGDQLYQIQIITPSWLTPNLFLGDFARPNAFNKNNLTVHKYGKRVCIFPFTDICHIV